MNPYAETLLYGLQIASVLFWAGPVVVRAERQRTLSRNPGWVRANPEFLETHASPSLMPLKVCGWLLLAALCAALCVAAGLASPIALFAVHGPLFLVFLVGLIAHHCRLETGLRDRIPKDTRQHAPLEPRTLFRFLSPWSVIPLGTLLLAGLAINGIGFSEKSLLPGRPPCSTPGLKASGFPGSISSGTSLTGWWTMPPPFS